MVNGPKDKPKRTTSEDLGYRYNGSSWVPNPEEEDDRLRREKDKGKQHFKDENKETHK